MTIAVRGLRAGLMVLLLPALVACTPTTGPDEPSGTGVAADLGGGARTSAEASDEASPPDSAGTTPEEQLLAAFDTSATDEQTLAEMRRFQEAVADCMAAAGFEYTPDVPDQLSHDTGPSPAPGEEEEWAATWGFGISIDMSPLYVDAPPAVPDPNAEYVASLSEAGREAYRTALEGMPLEPGEDPDEHPDEQGCYVQSYGPEPTTPSEPPLVSELREQAAIRADEQTQTDPRIPEAVQTLVDCAADAGAVGYDGSPPEGFSIGVGDHTMTPTFGAWSAYEQVAAAWDELSSAGEPTPDELARFQQWERDMAVAELRCNAPLRVLVAQIQRESLRAVVAPHRAELEDLLATG